MWLGMVYKNKAEYMREYRIKNKEKIKEDSKNYYEKNKQKKATYGKIYYNNNKVKIGIYNKNNKEKILTRSKIWRDKHKYKKKLYDKDYAKENKEIRNNRRNYRLKNDVKYAIITRLRGRLKMAFMSYIKNGYIPKGKLIDWKSVIVYLDKTKPNNWHEYHIDHIIPLSKLDLTDEKQLKFANSPKNLQWLTAEENIRKGDSITDSQIRKRLKYIIS